MTLIGGYLDFSYLIELKKIYITDIYIEKQYKSSRIKNKKKIKKKEFDWGPLERLRNLQSYFEIWRQK